MRILRVIASADARSGGPIEGLRGSAEIHARMGHEIEVLTLDVPGAPGLADFAFPLHPMGPGRRLGKYRYSPELREWIQANHSRFDVAVVHGLWNDASVGGASALRSVGLPYVLFTHGMMDPYFRKQNPLKHLAKQLFWLVQGKALRDAHSVLFTTREEQQHAQGEFLGYRFRSQVVAYGARSALEATDGTRSALDAMIPELGGRPYLLFLSRIHPKKGCDLLVEAFSALAAQRPELALIIAGPDQIGQASDLRARATVLGFGDRLFLPGMLTGAAKAAAFQGAEAFVLPSHQENFGIAAAEALSAELPILTTYKVNIWREIEEAGAGLIEADTQDGIDALLARWGDLSAEDRQAMALAARQLFETRFTMDAAARDLADVLERAAGDRQNS